MTRGHLAGRARGTALIAAILLMLLLSATGLGLVLTASLEPAICRNFETASGALRAAESGILLAAHDLVPVADWSLVLRGTWTTTLLAPPTAAGPRRIGVPAPTWTSLTSVVRCGQVTSCSAAATATVTLERPWGHNNPVWRLLGVVRVGDGLDGRVMGPFDVGVWVGDDPSEADDDPLTDGGATGGTTGESPPGIGVILLRAEAFGIRGEHGVLRATLVRPGTGSVLRLRTWSREP